MTNFKLLSQRFGRLGLITIATVATLQFAGCASVTLPAASGTAGNVEKLKASGAQPINVGEFKAAPGKAGRRRSRRQRARLEQPVAGARQLCAATA